MRISDWSSDVCSSDLKDAGDHYVVNGQKVWTSYADKAEWIFCLVRTSKESKQGGISFVLFDMASEGVSTNERKSVVEGKSVSGRVNRGGSTSFKQKKVKHTKRCSNA